MQLHLHVVDCFLQQPKQLSHEYCLYYETLRNFVLEYLLTISTLTYFS